jgi:hypothetical protein
MPVSSGQPLMLGFSLCMETPHGQTLLRDTNDRCQTLCLNVELLVTQETANKSCCFVLPNSYTDQTVAGMA